MEELQAYAASLNIERPPESQSQDGFFVLQHWYPRIWNEWARDKDGAVPADLYAEDGETTLEIAETDDITFALKPALPKFAAKYAFGRVRCANEIAFGLYGSRSFLADILPKPQGESLERALGGDFGRRGEWRVGHNGLVKLVRWTHHERRAIPTAEDVMFAWLRDLGWTPALSAPGMLALQIFRRLDGYPHSLKNEKLLGLLEHMNGGLVQRDGSPADTNKLSQERQLSVGEVISRLRSTNGHRELYEWLLEKEVFKLGAVVQCPHCMRRSWFSLDSLKDLIPCPKCLNVFPALGHVESSKWSYKTTGPFSVANYAEGAYGVLLALSFFDDHSLSTIRTTRVVSFTAERRGEKKLEADFALFWSDAVYGEKKDGIAFGECKTYGHFEKTDVERMRYIASKFPGAVLVFATLRKSLTPKEVRMIARLAKAGRRYWKAERPINPVLILTATELLDLHGPPYCWEESHGKKYDRVRGLLDVCNATQQIYLGLPSWETEWHEKWQQRVAQRAAAKGK